MAIYIYMCSVYGYIYIYICVCLLSPGISLLIRRHGAFLLSPDMSIVVSSCLGVIDTAQGHYISLSFYYYPLSPGVLSLPPSMLMSVCSLCLRLCCCQYALFAFAYADVSVLSLPPPVLMSVCSLCLRLC